MLPGWARCRLALACVLLWIAWFFLPAATVAGGMVASLSYSFWNLLGVDFGNPMMAMGGGSDHGIFSFIGIAAILAPFIAPFIRVAWSRYLNAAPLGYILIAWWRRRYMNESIEAFGDL